MAKTAPTEEQAAKKWTTLTTAQRLKLAPALTEQQAERCATLYEARDIERVNKKIVQQNALFKMECRNWELYDSSKRRQLLPYLTDEQLNLPYHIAIDTNRVNKIKGWYEVVKQPEPEAKEENEPITTEKNEHKTELPHKEPAQVEQSGPSNIIHKPSARPTMVNKPANRSKKAEGGAGVQGVLF